MLHTKEELRELQAMPLEAKIAMTEVRIHEFVGQFGFDQIRAFVSFSGGKDSTVLLDICRRLYPEMRAVFCNTGLEYGEIQAFAKSHENVDVVRPAMRFDEVISTYGYPLISKEVAEAIWYARGSGKTAERKRKELMGKPRSEYERKTGDIRFAKNKWLPLAKLPLPVSSLCCAVMKKRPIKAYQRKTHAYPILATMADESRLREQGWLRTGCNEMEGNKIQSKPMSFWLEQDVLDYVVTRHLDICSVYGDIVAEDADGNQYDPGTALGGCKLKCTGCQRTGCIFCGFGFHLDKGETRFQRLARTHPKQYEYCIGGGQWVDNPAYDPTAPKMDGEWQNWNPKKIWSPSKEGLGMGKVFEMCNELYGKDFYRYE